VRTRLSRWGIVSLVLVGKPCIILTLLGALWGCGGGSGSGDSNTTRQPPTGTTNNADATLLASALIRAVQGGTVTVPPPHSLAGTSITIPPSALSADTTITINTSSQLSLPGVFGVPLDFGPDGTTFRFPATLTLVYSDAALPTGVNATDLSNMILAKVTANMTLTPLTNVRVETMAKKVSGETTSLSVYTLVLSRNTPP
jgi:hypothetical protein